MDEEKVSPFGIVVGLTFGVFVAWATFWCGLLGQCKEEHTNKLSEPTYVKPYQQGDLSNSGGTATKRKYVPGMLDDPRTTNDESNDQPLGYFGTETVDAYNYSSRNSYTVDVDVFDNTVQRIYFEKGGWVDMIDASECEDGYCYGTDENGTDWEFTY